MPAVDENRKLDAVWPAVVEERLDRGANRPAGVEDVVDEDDGLPLEPEVQRRRADDRLGMARRVAAPYLYVVAIERDVDGTQRRRSSGALFYEAAQPVRERDTARLDAHERHAGEVGVRLDHFVRDSRERAREAVSVQQDLLGGNRRRQRHSTPFRPHWTGLKGSA